MVNHWNKITIALCLKAQRQAIAAFCYAVLHHIPVSIWEPKNG